MVSDAEESNLVRALLSAGGPQGAHRVLRRPLQPPALSRKPEEPDAGGCLLWPGRIYSQTKRSHQTEDI